MKTIDLKNPPESFREAFYVWLNANAKTLGSLHDDFLHETGKSKHDEGCSFSEFCNRMFVQCKDGQTAIEVTRKDKSDGN